LDADLSSAHRVLCGDPLLANCIEQRPGLRVPGGWDGFEILIRAILGQQVSVAVGTIFASRIVERYGEYCERSVAGLNRIFPAPARLVDAPFESIGLPKSRAVTLRAAAAAVLAGDLAFHAGQQLHAFVERATSLPGIGLWTAQYVAMRALNHPDAFPAGDLVVQRMLGNGQRLNERQTLIRSEQWRPWRAYAALHLWYLASDLKSQMQVKRTR
jgi:AraC family transcriptional regulator of adaptative response / DNA-3-methyladenine glycosylase II